ncbi:hypothetical protein ACS0TY_027697 [Phlomoides rotata]
MTGDLMQGKDSEDISEEDRDPSAEVTEENPEAAQLSKAKAMGKFSEAKQTQSCLTQSEQ